MSVAEDIADYALLIGNGVTFGLGKKLVGGRAAEFTERAAQRQGFGGQAAETVAGIAGAAGAIKLGAKGLKVAKAGMGYLPRIAPGVERVAARVAAPLGNTARNNARVRLGLEALPTLSQRMVAGTIASPVRALGAVKAHPFLAGGAGLASFANYGMLDDGTAAPQARAATALPAAAAAAPAARTPKYAAADKMTDDLMAAIGDIKPGASTFDGMAGQIAASQGGNLSLRQMMALSEVANKIAPPASASKDPNYKNIAFGEYKEGIDAEFNAKYAAAKAKRATDPAGAQADLDAAYAARQQALKAALGVDETLEEQLAAAQAQGG